MSEAKPVAVKSLVNMRTFLLVWFGQTISIIGSELTGFALGVWIYQNTGSVTQFALIILCAELPGILLSFFLGSVVDRSDRRKIMIYSNLGAGAITIIIALLLFGNRLTILYICISTAMISICSWLLRPAFNASVTLMVPKRHLGRASGLMQTGQAVAQIISPLMAGFLVLYIGIHGVLLIDFCTYIIAILTLLIVHIPRPALVTKSVGRKSVLKEATMGWSFIISRPGLIGLLCFFAVTNLAITMSNILITPLMLSFTNVAVYGSVLSVTGAGMFTGGLLMSVWGGPKQRIKGVYFYGAVVGTALILEGIRPNAILIAIALFAAAFSSPVVRSCFIPILQSKTPPDIQGRIFAAVNVVAWSTVPIAYLITGPLIDYIFEPLFAANGLLSQNIGAIIGYGKGRGIGFLIILLGLMSWLATILALRYDKMRHIEKDLPDMIGDQPVVENTSAC